MLQQVLTASGLETSACAGLLGVNETIFAEWASGQRPIPESMVPFLATVLGVKTDVLRASLKQAKSGDADITPAIWYKFRGPRVVDADRDCVLLIRELGFHMHELETVTEKRAVGWSALFEGIRRTTDLQAPPREQGRQAARIFRQSTGLDQGATGIGEVFRGNLRNLGILVIESPITKSSMEGCSFYVGASGGERPCVFANAYKTTWFRRNMVLMHELAHAIFDAESAGAALDFIGTKISDDVSEERAEAFAQEALLPREVLKHLSQKNGVHWDSLDALSMAKLVAESQVEQSVVISAAGSAGLINQDATEVLGQLAIASFLPSLTERALETRAFIASRGADAAEWVAKRTTTVPTRSLRLPSKYVDNVICAFRDGLISRGKSARMLMIDEDTFQERFGIEDDVDE